MSILPLRRARRAQLVQRLFAVPALAAVLVPTVLGGTPAAAGGSLTSGWFVYFREAQPLPVGFRCAMGNDTVTVVAFTTSSNWFVVANSQTRATRGGTCASGAYFPGTNAVRSQSALMFWVNGQPTLCNLSANAYSGGNTQSLSAATARCGNGRYSSTSFHDINLSGKHRTAMMATNTVVAP
jgi:hypothetical protein